MLHPTLDIVAVNVREMTHLGLGNFVVNLADAFAHHPRWQTEGAIPPPLLKPDPFRQLGVNHLAVTKAAESGDRYKKAERDASRPTVEMHTVRLINWAAYRSVVENDASLVSALNLPPKLKTTSKAITHGALAIPQNPKGKHGKQGSILLGVGRVAGAVAYYAAVCKDDPANPESWSIRGPFHKSQNMEITDLDLGQLYYFKICCADGNGQSDWSAIISLRVL